MVNLINLQHDRFDDIMNDELEVGMSDPLRDILLAASEHVIHHSDLRYIDIDV